jgi:hypothetical protein
MVVGLILLGACAEPESRSQPVAVDSAGIRVVQLTDASSRLSELIDPVPVLTVGSESGSDGQDLFRVRSAIRTPSGDIFILNAGDLQLRRYDAHGKLTWRMGRAGEGPGEFRDPQVICQGQGNEIVVAETGRLTAFGATGRVLRVISAELYGPFYMPVACDGAGHIVLIKQQQPFIPGTAGATSWRDSTELLWIDESGSVAGHATGIPVDEFYPTYRFGRSGKGRLPWGRVTVFGAGSGVTYVGTGDGLSVLGYDTTGVVRVMLRVDRAPTPITKSDVNAYHRAQEAFRQRIVASGKEPDPLSTAPIPFPATRPPYDAIFIDARRRVWLREWPDSAADIEGRIWTVIDTDSSRVTRGRLPGRMMPLHSDTEVMLVVATDSLGLETVRLYRMK